VVANRDPWSACEKPYYGKKSDVAFVSFVFVMHGCELTIMSKHSTCLPETLLTGVGLVLCS
jgi:hypothetical protein